MNINIILIATLIYISYISIFKTINCIIHNRNLNTIDEIYIMLSCIGWAYLFR